MSVIIVVDVVVVVAAAAAATALLSAMCEAALYSIDSCTFYYCNNASMFFNSFR